MFELSRRVRFGIDLAPQGETPRASPAPVVSGRGHNTFAGWPPLSGLGVYCEFEVTCRGEADAETGYMMNITAIDAAVRDHVIPIVQRAVHTTPSVSVERILQEVTEILSTRLRAPKPGDDGSPAASPLARVRWRLTPYHSVAMTPDATDRVAISQQFEFAAAHRLHCPSMSAEDNKRTFGKCNNEHGHGHNYRIEPLVEVPLIGEKGTAAVTLAELERIVYETVIQRFDHANLNLDLPEFQQLNPSVEHIARVCHDLLRVPISKAGGRLLRVTVWETEKTSCTYPAEA